MNKRSRLAIWGIIAVIAIVAAGVGSYALAQSEKGDQPRGQEQPRDGHEFVSRHVDYDVTLNVTGDLSSVDPRLQGLLPLNLNAKGGADIEKGDNGPSAQGNLQLTGLDEIIKKLAAGNVTGDNSGARALSGPMAGIIGGALANVDFIVLDHQLYLKVGDVWYGADPRQMGGRDARKQEKNGDGNKACLEGAFPGGPQALLNRQTVGPEEIDGTATTHYSATVDVNKAVSEAITAARNCGKADEAAKLEAAQPQIAGAVKELRLDWWQDGDGQLRQAKAAVSVEPAALASIAGQVSGDQKAAKASEILKGISSVTLNATLKFSQFGQDFQIARPDGDIKPLPFPKGAGCKGRTSQDDNVGGASWRHGERRSGRAAA